MAEATVEGRTYTARSRHGPANELARQLVAAGLVDRPMVIRYHGLAGTLTYHPKSGSWVIATMGRIGAFDGHEHNSFDAFASPGG
jgi:hypothetical protein